MGKRLLAPGRKKEEEKEGEKGSNINIKKQMGNINKMNYVIFDNKKKILSRKNGNLKEESRNLKEESRKNGNFLIPSPEETAASQKLVDTFLGNELDTLHKFSEGTLELSKENLKNSLSIISVIIQGAGAVMPLWARER